nr:MAG TPA: hypothetical protein [Crassvirales sp.]
MSFFTDYNGAGLESIERIDEQYKYIENQYYQKAQHLSK